MHVCIIRMFTVYAYCQVVMWLSYQVMWSCCYIVKFTYQLKKWEKLSTPVIKWLTTQIANQQGDSHQETSCPSSIGLQPLKPLPSKCSDAAMKNCGRAKKYLFTKPLELSLTRDQSCPSPNSHSSCLSSEIRAVLHQAATRAVYHQRPELSFTKQPQELSITRDQNCPSPSSH